MELQYVPRWAWMFIGVIVGVLLGFSWSSNMSGYVEGIRTINPEDFERDIMLKSQSGGPLIKQIVIRPPEYSPATGETVNIVTYERLAEDTNHRQWWIPMRFVAPIPYKPAIGGRVEATPELTIEKYLTTLAQTNTDLKFHNGWWYIPKYAMVLGAVGGLVVIGGIWPTLISLMIGAGFGGPQKKEKGESLWGVKSGTTKKQEAPKPVVTAADQQRLQEITDAYSQNLQGAGMGMTGQAADQSQEPEEIRKLEAKTLEVAPEVARPGDDDDIEVKGEYYPVLIHHQKKKPDDPHAEPPAAHEPGQDAGAPPEPDAAQPDAPPPDEDVKP